MIDVDVEISEVGPRDGLQIVKTVMPSQDKLAWITAEADAGVREIEVCSFVSPKLVPQMADAQTVAAGALAIEGLAVAALVANLKGAERAAASGVHKVTLTVSASRAHSLNNVRKTPDEQVEEFRRIVALRDGLPADGRFALAAGVSTAFGCTLQGAVDEAEVVRLAAALAEAGADEISLADTVGYANPAQVRRLVRKVRAVAGKLPMAGHFHDTRGLGLANVLAAYDEGVRLFDASLGGLGGCPWAPGASGNVVTEDVVFMFEAMGVYTGINLDRLIDTRRRLEAMLPSETFRGSVAAAGPPKTFAA